jgi:hypothetical protein
MLGTEVSEKEITRTFHIQLTISNSYDFRYRPRRSCEHNIKMDLKENGKKGMDFTDMAQERGKLRVMSLWDPQNVRNSRPAEKLLAFREGFCFTTCTVTVRYTITQKMANTALFVVLRHTCGLTNRGEDFLSHFIYLQLPTSAAKCKYTCNIQLPILPPATIDFTLFMNVSIT